MRKTLVTRMLHVDLEWEIDKIATKHHVKAEIKMVKYHTAQTAYVTLHGNKKEIVDVLMEIHRI
jgi:hypothetical protein